jgi:hypothetical protein
VRGREDPDLAGALAGVGLTHAAQGGQARRGRAGAASPAGWATLTREVAGAAGGGGGAGGSPARGRRHFTPGDEIVAVDGWRVATRRRLAERLGRAARESGAADALRRDEETRVRVVSASGLRTWEIVSPRAPGRASARSTRLG